MSQLSIHLDIADINKAINFWLESQGKQVFGNPMLESRDDKSISELWATVYLHDNIPQPIQEFIDESTNS